LSESKITVPEQAILTASLLNNIAIAAARDGGAALHAAIAMLRRAIALNPLDFGHRLNLATFLIELGRDDEAEELATFVLKHNDRAAIAWQIMGVVNTDRGRLSDAVACFKRGHEIDPNHGQHRFDLAAAYLRAGDFASGLPLYEFRSAILPKTGEPPNAPTWRE
jgi:tetratricopeptide (TPR) repeat protein